MQTSEKGHFGQLAATDFTAAAARAPISISSPSRRRPRCRLVSKPIARHRIVWWYEQAQRAFDWFIGWNDLGLELYSPETAAAATGCTWTGSTETRAPNPPCLLAFPGGNAIGSKHADKLQRTDCQTGHNDPDQHQSIDLKRSPTILKPDQSRVLLRPFTPGDPSARTESSRGLWRSANNG